MSDLDYPHARDAHSSNQAMKLLKPVEIDCSTDAHLHWNDRPGF